MPECLYGGCWTPAEVARAQSVERYESFMRIVEESQQVVEILDADSEEQEPWYDAPKEIPV